MNCIYKIMKSIILIISCFLFLFGNVFAQKNSLSKVSITARIYVVNVGTNSIDVQVIRIENSLTSNSVNYFCWDVCYTPPVKRSINPVTIAPGDTTKLFYAAYDPKGDSLTSDITYCFYNANDITDSMCVNVLFGPDGVLKKSLDTVVAIISMDFVTGTSEIFLALNENKISNTHPNPSDEVVRLYYTLKSDIEQANIIIRDILGSVVKNVKLSKKYGKTVIQVSELNAGIYFYSLVVDNKTYSTKKLIISR